MTQGGALSAEPPSASEAWRYWRSLADVLPLLTPLQPHVESVQQLPALDPRAAPAEIRSELTEFLHALYCVVEGVNAHLGCTFVPSRRLLRPRMEYSSANDGQRRVYRHGTTWLQVFEREFSGPWPAWWSERARGAYCCVVERTLLQLKVLLACMVLDSDDSLAVIAFCSCQPDPELHTCSQEYAMTIYYSHCLRCYQPYALPSATFETLSHECCESVTLENYLEKLVGTGPPGHENTEESLRRHWYEWIAKHEQRPGYWQTKTKLARIYDGKSIYEPTVQYVFVNECKHDQSVPGYPVQYICHMSPIAAHLSCPMIMSRQSLFPARITAAGQCMSVGVMASQWGCGITRPLTDVEKHQFDALPRLAEPLLVENSMQASHQEQRPDYVVTDPKCDNACRDRERLHINATLRLPISQFEPLLTWVEARARSTGKRVPYMCEGFVPASVLPSAASFRTAAGDDSPEDTIELPPLTAECEQPHDQECEPDPDDMF